MKIKLIQEGSDAPKGLRESPNDLKEVILRNYDKDEHRFEEYYIGLEEEKEETKGVSIPVKSVFGTTPLTPGIATIDRTSLTKETLSLLTSAATRQAGQKEEGEGRGEKPSE